MDFIIREQGFFRLGKLLCAIDLPRDGVLGIPINEPDTEELQMEN